MQSDIEEEKESKAAKTEPEQREEENRERSPRRPRRDLPLLSLFFLVPVYHRSIDRHFSPPSSTAEENMIYRGQHHKQQHSLTNTQWQPRPHADTLPHYKSREVAGWGKKKKRERERERGERERGREREIERESEREREM